MLFHILPPDCFQVQVIATFKTETTLHIGTRFVQYILMIWSVGGSDCMWYTKIHHADIIIKYIHV